MKNISISKVSFLGYLALAFFTGAILSRTLAEIISQEYPIPNGTWMSLYTGDAISLQLNLTQAVTTPHEVTSWLREDRQSVFAGSTGVEGKTVLSKVTINCSSRMVTVYEQRSFNDRMEHLNSSDGDAIPVYPEELGTMVATLALCGLPEEELENLKLKTATTI